MQSVEFNLSFLENALDEMETYLLQDELFWPLSTSAGVRQGFPRLTIANLLLALNELEAQEAEIAPVLSSKSSSLQTRWEALHTKWRSAVESKASGEMGARLNLWKAYMVELEEKKGRQLNYAQEVTHRVRFALLHEHIGNASAPDDLIDLMQAVDSQALALTAPSEFVWDARLEPIYPREDYIFLYRTPKENN
jgi:hypothetical protein